MRIALISDTHLSPRSPECVANWHAARRAVERLRPDATVHLGDITLDGQRHGDELAYAAALVQRWPTEMRCLPGNHDMGDASGEAALDGALLANYQRLFGADRWSVTIDGWQLLGINAQLLGSDTPQELEQWRWIDKMAVSLQHGTRTALFLHRPMVRVVPNDENKKGRYIADTACDRLLSGPLSHTLKLVVSGHTHQYLDRMVAGVRHVWMPSAGFVLPDEMQLRVGEKVVGLGLLELDADTMRFDLWCPDGMMRHVLSSMAAFQALAQDQVLARSGHAADNQD